MPLSSSKKRKLLVMDDYSASTKNRRISSSLLVEKMFRDASLTTTGSSTDKTCKARGGVHSDVTTTRGGWCLREGLEHVISVDSGFSLSLVQSHGIPNFYSIMSNRCKSSCRHEATQNIKDPATCFQSLCRIVAGQFVSGHAAQSVWRKLVEATLNDVTPKNVLRLVQRGKSVEEGLQQRIGVTKRKACTILELAERFDSDILSEELLCQAEEDEVRKLLLDVKGLGPWSCDMFLLFFLERPNILPIGDLGVRKGIQAHFGLVGSAAKGSLCAKKDEHRILKRLEPYRPYFSLLTYYMWRVADTPTAAPEAPEDGPYPESTSSPDRQRENTRVISP